MQGTKTRHKGDTKMKKLAFILSLLLFFSSAVLADENTSEQTVKNEQAYFTANLQKQPEKQCKQKIGNHFSFFVVNIQINGKIKDSDTANE